MIHTLQEVFEKALERLAGQVVTYVPPLLVGVTILVLTFLLARLVRVLFARAFKGTGVDSFLRDSGVSTFLPGSAKVTVAPVMAAGLYWTIVLMGLLTALNVFETPLTSHIVEGTVFLFPKLVGAGAIVLAGFWLGQFLGRSMLIWACNEGIPHARRLAAAVRVAVVFMSVVIASDILNFAQRVFFTAFVVVAGGAALAVSLALGLGAREAVGKWLAERRGAGEEDGESLLRHL
jgi:hypothetical protein